MKLAFYTTILASIALLPSQVVATEMWLHGVPACASGVAFVCYNMDENKCCTVNTGYASARIVSPPGEVKRFYGYSGPGCTVSVTGTVHSGTCFHPPFLAFSARARDVFRHDRDGLPFINPWARRVRREQSYPRDKPNETPGECSEPDAVAYTDEDGNTRIFSIREADRPRLEKAFKDNDAAAVALVEAEVLEAEAAERAANGP